MMTNEPFDFNIVYAESGSYTCPSRAGNQGVEKNLIKLLAGTRDHGWKKMTYSVIEALVGTYESDWGFHFKVILTRMTVYTILRLNHISSNIHDY